MKKRITGAFLALLLVVACIMGCDSNSKEEEKKDGKVSLTLMTYVKTDAFCDELKEMVVEKFPQYNITVKTWDEPTAEQTIKTAYAADQAIDVVAYWPTYLQKFEGTGIPMDLTKYLEEDAKWKDSFAEGTLEVGQTEEGQLAIPNSTVYPVMLYNKELFEAAGVEEIEDHLSWSSFMELCQKIQDSGKMPIAVQKDWAGWFVRNGLLQCWDDQAELDQFIAGEIPFTDPKAKKVMDNITQMYESDYVYPGGKEAVTTSPDDSLASFLNGESAIFCNVVANAKSVVDQVGDKFDLGVMSWPSMAANDDMYNLLGSSMGYMVMSNTKYPDEAVEVVKYLTGPEAMQLMADYGTVVPSTEVVSDDENYQLYNKDSARVYPNEVINLSSEIFDNMVYNQPSKYLYDGEAALTELDALREAAKK